MLVGAAADGSDPLARFFLAAVVIGATGCRYGLAYTKTGGVYRIKPASGEVMAPDEYLRNSAALVAWVRETELEPVYASNVHYVYGPPPAPTPRSPRDLVKTETDLPAFDPHAARGALNAVDVSDCREAGARRGFGHAKVVMNPDGRVSKVIIDEPAGMSDDAVKCVGDRLGAATVPPFKGSLVTVGTTFNVS